MSGGVFGIVAAALTALIAMGMIRLFIAQTVYDRILAAGMVGTNVVALIVAVGFVYERPDMFVDLALTYALLNFVGTVAAAKYLARRSKEEAE